MKNRDFHFSGIGAISLFITFVILSMIIVASLSLMNANQAKKLTDRQQEELELYYDKEAVAQKLYSKINHHPNMSQKDLQEMILTEFPQEEIEIEQYAPLIISIKMKENTVFRMKLDITQSPVTQLSWGRERR